MSVRKATGCWGNHTGNAPPLGCGILICPPANVSGRKGAGPVLFVCLLLVCCGGLGMNVQKWSSLKGTDKLVYCGYDFRLQ